MKFDHTNKKENTSYQLLLYNILSIIALSLNSYLLRFIFIARLLVILITGD